MGLFSKKSNPEPPKIDPKQQGKESDVARNQKYMHTPKHAYIDALNSTAGAYTSENRILIKEAAERRKSRLESESSFASNGRARLSGPWDSQISSNSRKEEKPAASRESHAKHSSTNSSGMRSAKKEYRRSALGTMAESSLEEAESISEHVTLPHIENPVKSPSAASSYTYLRTPSQTSNSTISSSSQPQNPRQLITKTCDPSSSSFLDSITFFPPEAAKLKAPNFPISSTPLMYVDGVNNSDEEVMTVKTDETAESPYKPSVSTRSESNKSDTMDDAVTETDCKSRRRQGQSGSRNPSPCSADSTSS